MGLGLCLGMALGLTQVALPLWAGPARKIKVLKATPGPTGTEIRLKFFDGNGKFVSAPADATGTWTSDALNPTSGTFDLKGLILSKRDDAYGIKLAPRAAACPPGNLLKITVRVQSGKTTFEAKYSGKIDCN